MVSKLNEPMRNMSEVQHILASSMAAATNEDHSFVADVPAYLFAYRYGLSTLFKKLDVSSDTSRLHKECEASYLATEERIAQVNLSIRSDLRAVNPDPRRLILISKIRRKVLQIIGSRPSLRELALGSNWGPGATLSLKSVESTVDKKLIEPRLSITPRCVKYAVAYMSDSFLWMRARLPNVDGPCSPLKSEFDIVHWGRFSSVPKTTAKRRPIDVQPTLNLFFQKGAGSMIRRRLKREGIDLDDQSRNQRLAGAAFYHGLSTIDLEGASDSVSTELVRAILPEGWYDLLSDLRTPMIKLSDGSIHNLSKFSSMGNGFTFELESLIFYALCYVIVRDVGNDSESPIAVYGDDIIVHKCHYDNVVEALNLLGFIVNPSKSFKDGFFFESCGKHFYKGMDVTPPYQKDLCVSALDWVRFANRLWRWAFRLGGELCVDSAVRPAFEFCSRQAEIAWARQLSRKRTKRSTLDLPRQPWWLEGDWGLIGDVNHLRDWRFDVDGIARPTLISQRPLTHIGSGAALYYESLRGDKPLSAKPSYGFVTPRGRVKEMTSRRRVYRMSVWSPDWV